MGPGQVEVGAGLSVPVGQSSRGGDGGVLRGGEVGPVPLPIEVVGEAPRELPDVLIEPGVGGSTDGRKQHLVFDREPRHRLRKPGMGFGGDSGSGPRRGDRIALRSSHPVAAWAVDT
jgi:hypothetical protein